MLERNDHSTISYPSGHTLSSREQQYAVEMVSSSMLES